MSKLALYTTIHPGTRPYLADWYASLCAQTDSDFDLWIGIDGINIDEARSTARGALNANWVQAEAGDTPAQVRERAWRALIPHADAVVMVDADDIMRTDRVEQARRLIASYDVVACSLCVVDAEGNDVGYVMPPSDIINAETVFPDYNVFGLSNSTYRTHVLESCLPIPAEVTFVDWYVATRAWLGNRDLHLDSRVRMAYRQHGGNTCELLPPYSPEGVQRTTHAVRKHFQAVTAHLPPGACQQRVSQVRYAADRVERFINTVLSSSERLGKYVSELNQIDPAPLWWASVAHPKLEHLWTKNDDVVDE